MRLAEVKEAAPPSATTAAVPANTRVDRPPRDLQRCFQLVLATVWLLDAVLQLQPFMFTRGPNGFSGMLNGFGAGNPSWIAHTITWNASNVYHQPILTNTVFAGVQFLIAFGIIYPRTIKLALALSMVWALGVWWFGEGLGGIFLGGATPYGGGPGGVLFYGVLAVLLWPSDGSDQPFVAARAVGVTAAKAIWVGVWGILAVLSLVGSGRSPQALHDLVAGLNSGQPGWLAHIDRSSESLFLHHGTTMAILLAIVCVVVAVGVFMPPQIAQATVVLAIVVFALIWIAVQNFGGILYWPLTEARSSAKADGASRTLASQEA
jgi:hypothetical protein